MVSATPYVGKSTDAVIIGGGPAGLAAAIALRQKGISCLVVEAPIPPIDKGCGEGLMPDALLSLRKLGVEIAEEDGYPFKGIRFVNATYHVDAHFSNGAGIGVRRPRLHHRMSEKAQEAGAMFAWGSRAKLLNTESLLVNGVKTHFRWLIGADGQASGVRKWAGLEKVKTLSQRFGFRRHYEIAPWSECVEVHWGSVGQIYITPVAQDCVCVVFITHDSRVNREHFLSHFPEIAHKLKNARIVTQERGAISATRKLKRVANGAIALIGDASGSADSITGEGLAISFRQAIALAASIDQDSLSNYRKEHHIIGRLPHAISRLMLTMDHWPAVEKRGMRVLASKPVLFEELLAVHMGAMSPCRFALERGPLLGWNFLTASS